MSYSTCITARRAGALSTNSTISAQLLRGQAALVSATVGDQPDRHGLAGAVVSRVLAEQNSRGRFGCARPSTTCTWCGRACAPRRPSWCARGWPRGIVLLAPAAERADSLRALVTTMAMPGTDVEPLPLAPGMEAPRVTADAVMPLMLASDLTLATDQDVELAISGVVTREGRIEQTQQLEGTPNLRLVQSLEDSARFHPASRAGSPVAVSLVWLVSHTTVRPPLIKPQSSRRVASDIST